MQKLSRQFLILDITLALWAAVLSPARADETFPTLNVGGLIYSNVTVTLVTGTDIYFKSDTGMANAKLKDLDPALQSQFGYDPKQSDAAEQARRAQAAQYYQQVIATARTAPAASQTAPPPAANVINSATNSASDSWTNNLAFPDDRSQGDIQAELDQSIARVKEIVNQPVSPVPPESGKRIGRFPFWFHGDTAKPDFNNVDVRKSQDLSYAAFDLVAADMNPSVCYPADQVEINTMTRYFYPSTSAPQKKLSEDEMLEINKLYRIIGHDQQALGQ